MNGCLEIFLDLTSIVLLVLIVIGIKCSSKKNTRTVFSLILCVLIFVFLIIRFCSNYLFGFLEFVSDNAIKLIFQFIILAILAAIYFLIVRKYNRSKAQGRYIAVAIILSFLPWLVNLIYSCHK